MHDIRSFVLCIGILKYYLLFKDVASVRWRGDIRLRGRDKSVENLKNHFTKIAEQNGLTEDIQVKMAEICDNKDNYKPMWRASTVNTNIKRLNVGKLMTARCKREFEYICTKCPKTYFKF